MNAQVMPVVRKSRSSLGYIVREGMADLATRLSFANHTDGSCYERASGSTDRIHLVLQLPKVTVRTLIPLRLRGEQNTRAARLDRNPIVCTRCVIANQA